MEGLRGGSGKRMRPASCRPCPSLGYPAANEPQPNRHEPNTGKDIDAFIKEVRRDHEKPDLLSHIAAMPKETSLYKRYLEVVLDGKKTTAFIDSGNVFRSVISENFFKTLGGRRLKPLAMEAIGTAHQGAKLQVLGELATPLKMTVPSINKSYTFHPVVIRGLAMPINISGPFMRANSWDEIHSRNCLNIRGADVPLRASSKLWGQHDSFKVYALQALTIQPGETRKLEVQTVKGGGCQLAVWREQKDPSPYQALVKTG